MKKSALVGLNCTLLLVAGLSLAGVAQAPVSIELDGSGLASLKFNGAEMLSSGALRVNRITFQNGSGGTYAADLTGSLAVDRATGEIKNTYGWGTVSVVHTVRDNRLDMTLTVTNKGSSAIQGVFLEPLELRLPSRPAEYDNVTPLIMYDPGEPGVLALTTPTATVVLAHDDPGAAIVAGFPWANDRPMSTVFPLRINTDREPGYPDSYPTVNRPIAPGSSDHYRFSLRFGSAGSTADTLAADVWSNFAARFPRTLQWADKRPIGQLILATSVAGFPKNPRGWLLDPTIDTTTPAGLAVFKTRIMAWADESVAILKQLDAQGMITWDIEGEEYPHPTTYLCDPRALPQAAPEMDAIADEYFRKFTSAGLRVGVCIRPQTLVLSGANTSQQPAEDPGKEMADKIAYAKARWGATLFYLDSNGDPNLPLDADIMRRVSAAHRDVLIIPEHENTRYYAYTVPYRELRQNQFTTPDRVRLTYPAAFGVTYVADGDFGRHYNSLVTAVQKGDMLMPRAWFSDPANDQVRRIYAAGSGLRAPAAPTRVRILPAPGQGVAGNRNAVTAGQIVVSPAVGAEPAACSEIPSDAFLGCYYKLPDFAGFLAARMDPSIDFAWGDAAPMPGMRAQNFTVRWRGRFTFTGGNYQFALNLDDGARLYIDEQPVWDLWGARSSQRHLTTLPISAGSHVLRLDYAQFSGSAGVSLAWSPDGTPVATGARERTATAVAPPVTR